MEHQGRVRLKDVAAAAGLSSATVSLILNGMSDRGEMTGEWLANCQACSLPEFCSVFNRAGTKYDVDRKSVV